MSCPVSGNKVRKQSRQLRWHTTIIYAEKNLQIILLLQNNIFLLLARLSASPLFIFALMWAEHLGCMSERTKRKSCAPTGAWIEPLQCLQECLNWLNVWPKGRWGNFSVLLAAVTRSCSEAGKFSFSYGTGWVNVSSCELPTGSTAGVFQGRLPGQS